MYTYLFRSQIVTTLETLDISGKNFLGSVDTPGSID